MAAASLASIICPTRTPNCMIVMAITALIKSKLKTRHATAAT